METTNQLLDAIKARYGLPSDYALAAKVGITRSGISGYRHGRTKLGDEQALKVAELLELDEGYVLACMEAERTHSEAARRAWEKLATRLKSGGVAAALLLLVATPAPTPANAAPLLASAGDCILCKIRRAVALLRSSLGNCGRSWLFSHAPIPL